ncbi:chymotrypsin-like protease CTRL-1 [Drosophila takahashii]|uniref:chymotrypsin-like protease CTRL-1 n=1 Tax=Drosophila takahashii TaxID=29030 RepID=UPI001CF8C259|nr:serine protease gd-like [Drosophila takahashii]
MNLELVVILSLISLAMGQIRPESSCSKYFRYVNVTAEEIQGEITLPTLKQGHNRIDLLFSQTGDQDDFFVGQLKPYPDEKEIQWRTGPYKFRITISPSVANEKPKLSQLVYNDQLLCGEYVLYASYQTRFYEFFKNGSLDRSPLSPNVCGRQGSIAPFVIGGKNFPLGRYPWLSAIFLKEENTLSFECVATLISASIVISAAHCVHLKTEFDVFIGLGLHNLDSFGNDGSETRSVKRLLLHPDVKNDSFNEADIVLITMERPVTFNQKISPICLWTEEASRMESTHGIVAGWELTSSKYDNPWVVQVDIASPEVCALAFTALSLSNRTLCAGHRSGACVGDHGVGLMVLQGDRWLLRGIVLVKRLECDFNEYVPYCDLSKYINWINDNISG